MNRNREIIRMRSESDECASSQRSQGAKGTQGGQGLGSWQNQDAKGLGTKVAKIPRHLAAWQA